MSETLNRRIEKVERLLKKDISMDVRRIWRNHLSGLMELRWQKANERIEALARLGGGFIE